MAWKILFLFIVFSTGCRTMNHCDEGKVRKMDVEFCVEYQQDDVRVAVKGRI